MRIPYNRDNQIILDIIVLLLLLMLAASANQIRQRAAAAGQIEVTDVIIELIGLVDLIFLLIL